MKGGFFDRNELTNPIDRAIKSALSKFGAFTRQVARGSIRKGKKPSRPGTPPRGHGAQLLKNFILFSYDQDAKSVIIGPAKLNTHAPTPALMEYGGNFSRTRRRVQVQIGGTVKGVKKSRQRGGAKFIWVDVGSRLDDGAGPLRTEQLHYPERPYMRPAFIKARKDLEKFWAKSVKK